MVMKRLRISAGGQVSVPAAVRNRWKTKAVVADDRGDHLILRPALPRIRSRPPVAPSRTTQARLRRDAPPRPRRGTKSRRTQVRSRPGLILLDANALIALLKDEPAAGEVAELLRDRDCATPASCLSEVVDRLIRRVGVRPEDVVDRLEPVIDASLASFRSRLALGWLAGELRASTTRGAARTFRSQTAFSWLRPSQTTAWQPPIGASPRSPASWKSP